MSKVGWAQKQPWWSQVANLMDAGWLVKIHVPHLPEQYKARCHIQKRSTGGYLVVEECLAPVPYISYAMPQAGVPDEVLNQLKNESTAATKKPDRRFHTPHAGWTGPEVGEA